MKNEFKIKAEFTNSYGKKEIKDMRFVLHIKKDYNEFNYHIKFLDGPTGYESYYLNTILKSDLKKRDDGFCICSGCSFYNRCYIDSENCILMFEYIDKFINECNNFLHISGLESLKNYMDLELEYNKIKKDKKYYYDRLSECIIEYEKCIDYLIDDNDFLCNIDNTINKFIERYKKVKEIFFYSRVNAYINNKDNIT